MDTEDILYSDSYKSKKLIKAFRQSPELFMEQILGVKLYDYQKEILLKVRDSRYTTVKSAHNVGKTWFAAQVVLWFLYCYPPTENDEQTVVVTTAPGNRQVDQQLWGNIRNRINSSRIPLPGRILKKPLLEVDGQRWYAFGFAAKDTDRFQGFHATNMLVIADEAAGIDEHIFTGIHAITTSENNKILLIGNPTTTSGTFFNSFKDEKYSKVSIPVFNTPNFKSFGITETDIINNTWQDKITGPLPSKGTITPQKVYDLFLEWGINSPYWVSRIKAQFPEQAENTLLPLGWIEQSIENNIEYAFENDIQLK